jgi:hypothetical protein
MKYLTRKKKGHNPTVMTKGLQKGNKHCAWSMTSITGHLNCVILESVWLIIFCEMEQQHKFDYYRADAETQIRWWIPALWTTAAPDYRRTLRSNGPKLQLRIRKALVSNSGRNNAWTKDASWFFLFLQPVATKMTQLVNITPYTQRAIHCHY